ncbi:MAG: helix-turn-helix transcriptional regulator, partial [Thermoanaerobaculia bacterium]|nr:helix-turn-helix transcriptional regulator [Thermoanaerobaculia bacterium]
AHRHRNLLALAHDAGFNSKTSFNRVFKAATGKTPSAWRRALDAGADPVAAAPGT